MITHERARELLDYCPETGVLVWKPRGNSRFDGRFAGKLAGTPKAEGYIQIMVDGRLDYAHRLAWLIITGSYPDRMIDHANGDPSDNRWVNLRIADHAQNGWNTGLSRTNKTGFKGVCFDKRSGKYAAYICVNSKRKNLGLHKTPEEAYAAYCKAAADLHGEYHRLA